MIAARLAGLRHGGDRGNQHTGGKPSIDDLKSKSKSRTEAAKDLKVSTKSVDRVQVGCGSLVMRPRGGACRAIRMELGRTDEAGR